jgi:inorganic triphosphatase YgiF
MQEVELKFQVPPALRAAVDAAVAGRARAPRLRLQAAYFDTPSRLLASAGLALRLRREGRRWVQTLKGAGQDGMTRFEHEVELPPHPSAPQALDPRRHAGTEVGDRMIVLLETSGEPLVSLYRTDIRRRSRRLRTRHGVVELAFDDGVIVAGERRLRVCELEIESVSGSPLAVIATARSWLVRHGLWLDTRSKAERGDLLARGEAVSPVRKAPPVALKGDASLAQGIAAALLSCLAQIGANGSQVASGAYDGEHVHQLRVGLRRLRTVLRFYAAPLAAWPGLGEVTAEAERVFRALGAARDQVAIAEPIRDELDQALQAAGMRFQTPLLAPPPDATPPDALLRQPASQKLLLDLLGWTSAPPAVAGDDLPALRDHVAGRLRRWHRKAAALAEAFETLDDAGRHLLRKRVKRLRYAVEFSRDLYPKRRVRRYLKPLLALQERLGALMDVTVALALYRERSDSDPHALFAVGWLASRKEQLVGEAQAEMAAFLGAKRFWKK